MVYRFLFEDNEKSPPSILLSEIEKNVIFTDGNNNIIDELLPDCYNIVYLDTIPENSSTTHIYYNLCEIVSWCKGTVIPIPCIEYCIILAFKDAATYKDKLSPILNYGNSVYTLGNCTSFEKLCKDVLGEAYPKCIHEKQSRFMSKEVCDCKYCKLPSYAGSTIYQRSEQLWSELPIRCVNEHLLFNHGNDVMAAKQYYVDLYNRAAKLQYGITTSELTTIF